MGVGGRVEVRVLDAVDVELRVCEGVAVLDGELLAEGVAEGDAEALRVPRVLVPVAVTVAVGEGPVPVDEPEAVGDPVGESLRLAVAVGEGRDAVPDAVSVADPDAEAVGDAVPVREEVPVADSVTERLPVGVPHVKVCETEGVGRDADALGVGRDGVIDGVPDADRDAGSDRDHVDENEGVSDGRVRVAVADVDSVIVSDRDSEPLRDEVVVLDPRVAVAVALPVTLGVGEPRDRVTVPLPVRVAVSVPELEGEWLRDGLAEPRDRVADSDEDAVPVGDSETVTVAVCETVKLAVAEALVHEMVRLGDGRVTVADSDAVRVGPDCDSVAVALEDWLREEVKVPVIVGVGVAGDRVRDGVALAMLVVAERVLLAVAVAECVAVGVSTEGELVADWEALRVRLDVRLAVAEPLVGDLVTDRTVALRDDSDTVRPVADCDVRLSDAVHRPE